MQKSHKQEENKPKNIKLKFFDSVNTLLENLPERSREILKKRFGLASGEIETLEKIGKDYGVTRERVRQIIHDAIGRVHGLADTEIFKRSEERIILEIIKNSGIISEEKLIRKLGGGDPMESKAVAFFSACSKRISAAEDKALVKKSWLVSKNVIDRVKILGEAAKGVLEEAGSTLSDSEIVERIMSKDKDFSKNEILNFLDVLSAVSRNKFGKWGFSDWMEINPKGTRERIYLVLKEKKNPLHFREIAELIDKSGINKRKSHPQTVHNELIKDERFVLIGRGIYALSEWGYVPGTIKDVLESILKKAGRPMEKEEIVRAVLKARKVKKATIMINLNDKEKFYKTDGKYALKA